MAAPQVLTLNMELSNAAISPNDLLSVPATELKSRSCIIVGEPYRIPTVIRKTLQSPSRAEGILLAKKAEIAKQVRAVAGRLADLDVDLDELGEKTPTDLYAIQKAAHGIYKAIEKKIKLLVIPPYPFPRERSEGLHLDVSKQFRIITTKPLYEDIEKVEMPAIVPILDDWRHVAHLYSAGEKWELVKEISLHSEFGTDFAVAFGAAIGVTPDLLLTLQGDPEKILNIATRVYKIANGNLLESTDRYLEVAKIIEQGNRAKIPFEYVKYERSFLYGIDFGSVLFQKIKQANHFLNDEELFDAFLQIGRLMTFCPLDAFKFPQSRTSREYNMFCDKNPKAAVEKVLNFVYTSAATNSV